MLPESQGHVSRNVANSRLVIEGMLHRLYTGQPWRDLPEHFGPSKTVWKRHSRYAVGGTWDRVQTAVVAQWPRHYDKLAPPTGPAQILGRHGQVEP